MGTVVRAIMNWSTIIVAVVSGISTGFLTALITPWAQWAVDVRRDRRQSRHEFIERWKDFVASSDVRTLTDSDDYFDLVRRLTRSEKQQLRQLIEEYDKRWEHFQTVELPKLRHEAKDAINDESRFLANLAYGTSLDDKTVTLSCIQYVEEFTASAKQEISKPRHRFMREQLAKFNDRWRLL